MHNGLISEVPFLETAIVNLKFISKPFLWKAGYWLMQIKSLTILNYNAQVENNYFLKDDSFNYNWVLIEMHNVLF